MDQTLIWVGANPGQYSGAYCCATAACQLVRHRTIFERAASFAHHIPPPDYEYETVAYLLFQERPTSGKTQHSRCQDMLLILLLQQANIFLNRLPK